MIITLEENEDGLIFPIPDEIFDKLSWKEGDQVEWINNEDGTLTIRKYESSLSLLRSTTIHK